MKISSRDYVSYHLTFPWSPRELYYLQNFVTMVEECVDWIKSLDVKVALFIFIFIFIGPAASCRRTILTTIPALNISIPEFFPKLGIWDPSKRSSDPGVIVKG
jgi:hypothetical protein